jgi:hypothetical protein
VDDEEEEDVSPIPGVPSDPSIPLDSEPTTPFDADPPIHPDADPLTHLTTPLRGGATRFWTPDKKAYLDVRPKLGRVLVFQQPMLVHSGERVESGVKYTVRSDFMFVSEEGE